MPDQQFSEEDLKNMSPEQIAELQKQNCVFCKIINGDIPSKKIYQDDKTVAILDINPASEGHVLILPRDHYQILPQIPEDVMEHLFIVAKEVSHAILRAFKSKGTTVFVANGFVAGQKAPHFMIHVFSRKDDDGLFRIPRNIISPGEAAKLREHLQPKVNAMFGIEPEKELEKVEPEEDVSSSLDFDPNLLAPEPPEDQEHHSDMDSISDYLEKGHGNEEEDENQEEDNDDIDEEKYSEESEDGEEKEEDEDLEDDNEAEEEEDSDETEESRHEDDLEEKDANPEVDFEEDEGKVDLDKISELFK